MAGAKSRKWCGFQVFFVITSAFAVEAEEEEED